MNDKMNIEINVNGYGGGVYKKYKFTKNIQREVWIKSTKTEWIDGKENVTKELFYIHPNDLQLIINALSKLL